MTSQRGVADDVGIAFIYYDYQNQTNDSQSLPRCVCAMLKQLCWKSEDIPQHLLASFEASRSPTVLGNHERFVATVQRYRDLFVIVDALDECPKDNRVEMIEFLSLISQGQTSTKVFVTSRREIDIVRAFDNSGTTPIQIEAKSTAKDIQKYVEDEVEALRKGRNGRKLHLPSDSMAAEVVETLTSKANGM